MEMEPIIAEQVDKTKYKHGDVSISGEVIEMIFLLQQIA